MRKAIGAVLLLGIGAGLARGAEPSEAVTIRPIRPDRQLERLIALFRGARSSDPASALAAWKRATGGTRGLGKPLEAAIAALNPEMIAEFRTLDGAELGLGLDPGDGHVRWYATVPRDDGTVAAMATALTLTGGGSDPPWNGVTIDRLGPPGSAVVARVPGVLVVAGSRDELPVALARARAGVDDRPPVETGWWLRLDPQALAASGPVCRRRLVEVPRASGCQGAEAVAGLEGETLTIAISARFAAAAPGAATTIDPAWLEWLPASGTVASASVALDAGARAWDAAFALADRVERADSARDRVAPLRTRLNLLATAAGVRPEVDLWPKLRGLSGSILVDPSGDVAGTLLVLHAADPPAADRIATSVLPRLVASYLKGQEPADPADGVQRLARLSGRPLEVTRREATVLIGWGESALAAGLGAKARPERSAAATLRASWSPTPPRRAGAFWPGRLRALAPPDSPLAQALADAPPILWSGRDDVAGSHDTLSWTGLRGLVRRFLERIPLADAPED